jgi:hypothetical protein
MSATFARSNDRSASFTTRSLSLLSIRGRGAKSMMYPERCLGVQARSST